MIEYLRRLFNPLNCMNFNDVVKMALEGEFLSHLLDDYLDWIIKHNKLKKPTEAQIQEMRKKVIETMQKKYPDAGIVLKKEEK